MRLEDDGLDSVDVVVARELTEIWEVEEQSDLLLNGVGFPEFVLRERTKEPGGKDEGRRASFVVGVATMAASQPPAPFWQKKVLRRAVHVDTSRRQKLRGAERMMPAAVVQTQEQRVASHERASRPHLLCV